MKKKKSARRILVTKLDTAFSLYTRERDLKAVGHCAFCCKPIEHCFHFVTRANHKTRWKELNAVGSCAGCNYRMEFDPHPFITWFINKHGVETYQALVLESHGIAKYSLDDLEGMLKEFNEKREGLKKSIDN